MQEAFASRPANTPAAFTPELSSTTEMLEKFRAQDSSEEKEKYFMEALHILEEKVERLSEAEKRNHLQKKQKTSNEGLRAEIEKVGRFNVHVRTM